MLQPSSKRREPGLGPNAKQIPVLKAVKKFGFFSRCYQLYASKRLIGSLCRVQFFAIGLQNV